MPTGDVTKDVNDPKSPNHYRTQDGDQHWDMMWRLYGEIWFVGNVTKYVLRYKYKNGLQDLEKAKHYLEKLIDLETDKEERIKLEHD